MIWIHHFFLVLTGLFSISNSDLFNKTYGNLEFISPGTTASLSEAQKWCDYHGSTLAEKTSEEVWNSTLDLIKKSEFKPSYLHLNAQGDETQTWQWITGEPYNEETTYPLTGYGKYARLSISKNEELIINKGSSRFASGYVCEHEHDRRCYDIHEYNSVPPDGNCYIFHHNKKLTWFQANNECHRNNGRLATFKNITENKKTIAKQIQPYHEYWIGLYQYEWIWNDSRKVLTYTNWGAIPSDDSHACLYVHFSSEQWYSYKQCNITFDFVCLKDISKCDSNPCPKDTPGSETYKKITCAASIFNNTCQCASGSECQTSSSPRTETTKKAMPKLMIIVAVIASVILIILTSILVVCVIKNKQSKKSNDVEITRRFETKNTPEPAIYSEIKSSDRNENIDRNGNHPSGNAIYGQVVQSSNDDHKEDAITSSSMVYADLEFVQQDKKAPHPDPG